MTKLKDMTLEELQEKKEKYEKSLDELRDQVAVLFPKIERKVKHIETINELIDEKTIHTKSIDELLEYEPETKTKRKKRTEFLRQWGFRGESFFPKTGQTCIQIALYRDDDERTQKAYDGITTLLPYIKPLEDGRKCFDIFEHTLSLNYSYYLKVTPDGEWQVVTHRETMKPFFTSKDLMEALKFIQENLYYETGKDPGIG